MAKCILGFLAVCDKLSRHVSSRLLTPVKRPALTSRRSPKPNPSLIGCGLQGGRNYLQRGQEFVQQRMGFLAGGALQHHFNVSGDYGIPPASAHAFRTGQLATMLCCKNALCLPQHMPEPSAHGP